MYSSVVSLLNGFPTNKLGIGLFGRGCVAGVATTVKHEGPHNNENVQAEGEGWGSTRLEWWWQLVLAVMVLVVVVVLLW